MRHLRKFLKVRKCALNKLLMSVLPDDTDEYIIHCKNQIMQSVHDTEIIDKFVFTTGKIRIDSVGDTAQPSIDYEIFKELNTSLWAISLPDIYIIYLKKSAGLDDFLAMNNEALKQVTFKIYESDTGVQTPVYIIFCVSHTLTELSNAGIILFYPRNSYYVATTAFSSFIILNRSFRMFQQKIKARCEIVGLKYIKTVGDNESNLIILNAINFVNQLVNIYTTYPPHYLVQL